MSVDVFGVLGREPPEFRDRRYEDGAASDRRRRFVPAGELRASLPSEPGGVLGAYLVSGNVTLLGGKPKVGKSTLALAITEAIGSHADSFLGQPVNGGPVLYVSEETGSTLIHKLLAGGGRCPICGGKGRVAASFSKSLAGGAVGKVNVEAPGGGGAGASEGGGPTGGFNSARLDLERAKRMRARRQASQRAYVAGDQHATPKGKYTDDQIQALGEMDPPKALAKPGGGYHYPIVDTADLINALVAYKRETGAQPGVRRCLIARAIAMNATHHLPKGWAEPKVPLHPRETEP